MAMLFKKGQKVQQVVRVIKGEVIGVGIVDDVVQYQVGYEEDGEQHSRFFTEEQLEAAPAEETPAEE